METKQFTPEWEQSLIEQAEALGITSISSLREMLSTIPGREGYDSRNAWEHTLVSFEHALKMFSATTPICQIAVFLAFVGKPYVYMQGDSNPFKDFAQVGATHGILRHFYPQDSKFFEAVSWYIANFMRVFYWPSKGIAKPQKPYTMAPVDYQAYCKANLLVGVFYCVECGNNIEDAVRKTEQTTLLQNLCTMLNTQFDPITGEPKAKAAPSMSVLPTMTPVVPNPDGSFTE